MLQGDQIGFTGPHLGPTQRGFHKKPRACSYFNMQWNDEMSNHLGREINTYASQQCSNLNEQRKGCLAKTNGRLNSTPTVIVELQAWLGYTNGFVNGSMMCKRKPPNAVPNQVLR